eukprot:scaffold9150_cov120-Isochrysis_galbana.AAC.24
MSCLVRTLNKNKSDLRRRGDGGHDDEASCEQSCAKLKPDGRAAHPSLIFERSETCVCGRPSRPRLRHSCERSGRSGETEHLAQCWGLDGDARGFG